MGFLDSQSATAAGTGGVGESVWASGGTVNGGNSPNNMLFHEIEVMGIDVALGTNAQMGVNAAASALPDFFYLTRTNAYMKGGTNIPGDAGGMMGGMSPNLPSGSTYFNGQPTWNWYDVGDGVGEDNLPTWQLRYGSGVGPGTELSPGWHLGTTGHHADHPLGNASEGGGQGGRWELVNRGNVVAVAAGNHINPCYSNQGTGYTYSGPGTEVNPYSANSSQSRKWIVNTGSTTSVAVTGTTYDGGGAFAISAVTCIPNNVPVNRKLTSAGYQ